MSEDLVRVEPPDARRPARAASAELLALPRLIVDAGPAAVGKFLEFFAARIANRRTRAAYGRAVGQFLAWCEARGLALEAVSPLHVAAYIRTHRGSAPTVKQHLAAIRMLGDWLVVSQVLPVNPAAAVADGPLGVRGRRRSAGRFPGRGAGARLPGDRRARWPARVLVSRGGRRGEPMRHDGVRGGGELFVVPGRGVFQPDAGPGRVDVAGGGDGRGCPRRVLSECQAAGGPAGEVLNVYCIDAPRAGLQGRRVPGARGPAAVVRAGALRGAVRGVRPLRGGDRPGPAGRSELGPRRSSGAHRVVGGRGGRVTTVLVLDSEAEVRHW